MIEKFLGAPQLIPRHVLELPYSGAPDDLARVVFHPNVPLLSCKRDSRAGERPPWSSVTWLKEGLVLFEYSQAGLPPTLVHELRRVQQATSQLESIKTQEVADVQRSGRSGTKVRGT